MKASLRNLQACTALFAVSIVMANILAIDTIALPFQIFGVTCTIPGSAPCYFISYLMGSVIIEIYNKQEAVNAVIAGNFAQITAVMLSYITLMLLSADTEIAASATTILSSSGIFTIAGLVAYNVSQIININMFQLLNKHFDQDYQRWICSTGALLVSQFFDTTVFISIGYGLGLGWRQGEQLTQLLVMMICHYVLKLLVIMIDAPMFMLLTRATKEDRYD